MNQDVDEIKKEIAHHLSGAIYHPLEHGSGGHAMADAIEKLIDAKVAKAMSVPVWGGSNK